MLTTDLELTKSRSSDQRSAVKVSFDTQLVSNSTDRRLINLSFDKNSPQIDTKEKDSQSANFSRDAKKSSTAIAWKRQKNFTKIFPESKPAETETDSPVEAGSSSLMHKKRLQKSTTSTQLDKFSRAKNGKKTYFDPCTFEKTYDKEEILRAIKKAAKKHTKRRSEFPDIDEQDMSSTSSMSDTLRNDLNEQIDDPEPNNNEIQIKRDKSEPQARLSEEKGSEDLKDIGKNQKQIELDAEFVNFDTQVPLATKEDNETKMNDEEDEYPDDRFVDNVKFSSTSSGILEQSVYHRVMTKYGPSGRLGDDPEYKHLRWMLFPDDPMKVGWDLFIIAILLYTSWVLPLRLAFIDDSAVAWVITDWILNSCFFVDILVNFNTAYFDSNLNLITDRKKIAQHYLFGWFLVDLCAFIPFDELIGASNSYQQLLRVSRLPRLYKLLKLFKKFLGDNYVDEKNNWFKYYGFYDQNGNQIQTELEIYIACAYLVTQTIVTVGYGDLPAMTNDERIVCCFWMFVGVFIYSFIIGSLSSLIAAIDNESVEYSRRFTTLLELKQEYHFDNTLYLKIKNAIKYATKQCENNVDFLNSLPIHLRQDLSSILYHDVLDSIPFFAERPKSFTTRIAPLLTLIKVQRGETVFLKGDPADEMFFIKSGEVAYIIPQYFNFKFLRIREGYFFGETDLLFYGERRRFTVKATENSELYVLNKKDFKQIFLMDFRDIGLEIAKHAHHRKVRTLKAYKEAVDSFSKQKDFSKTDSKALISKATMYQDSILDISDESLRDSEEEEEKEKSTALFPGLHLSNGTGYIASSLHHTHHSHNSHHETTEEIEKKLSRVATERSDGADKLSQFFESTVMDTHRDLDPGGQNPLMNYLKKHSTLGPHESKQGATVAPEHVEHVEQRVTEIHTKLNNLLSLSLKLDSGLKTFADAKLKSTIVLGQGRAAQKRNTKKWKTDSFTARQQLMDHIKQAGEETPSGSPKPKPSLFKMNADKATTRRKSSSTTDLGLSAFKGYESGPRFKNSKSQVSKGQPRPHEEEWESMDEA